MINAGWIGFDWDNTLRKKDGKPIKAMVEEAKRLLNLGYDVRLFTACAYDATPLQYENMRDWCKKYLGKHIPIQAHKDHNLFCFFDDKAISIEKDTGRILAGNINI